MATAAATAAAAAAEPIKPGQHALYKTLGLTDLIFFGVTSILGTGSTNLVGHAVAASNNQFPLHIAGSLALLLGSSKTYADAAAHFKTNDAEARLVEQEIGKTGRALTTASIIACNIVSVAIGLIFITRLFFPEASSMFQIMLAIQLAIVLVIIGLYGIELNKTIVDSIGALSIGLFGMLSLIAVYSYFNGSQHLQNVNISLATSFDPARAFLYFFFILAGFDVLIKFTEETVDEANVARSFYGSNALSALLLLGICFAFVLFVPLRGARNFDNTFGAIAKGIWGDAEAEVVKWFAAAFVLIGGLVIYISTSRYIYSNLKGTVAEGWRELNAAAAPWKILLGVGGAIIATLLINNIDKLVALADLFLVAVLVAVSWSAARMHIKEGRKPWVEVATTLGLFGVGGISIHQLFTKKGHPGYSVAT
jgi:amino acid transporter